MAVSCAEVYMLLLWLLFSKQNVPNKALEFRKTISEEAHKMLSVKSNGK
jgi:hypothetical protein